MKRLCWIGFCLSFSSLAACSTLTKRFQATSDTAPSGSIQTLPAGSPIATTTPLTPVPLRVKLSDLPQPYASESTSKSPTIAPVPANPSLSVPQGFTVNLFALGLDDPRWLALTPEGDVLVTETRQNRILRLSDRNQDGVAEERSTFADARNGLNIPFGMAFSADSFFLGNTDAVRRFTYQPGQRSLQGQGDVITQLPGNGYRQHWTRNVVIAPDQSKLYVSI